MIVPGVRQAGVHPQTTLPLPSTVPRQLKFAKIAARIKLLPYERLGVFRNEWLVERLDKHIVKSR